MTAWAGFLQNRVFLQSLFHEKHGIDLQKCASFDKIVFNNNTIASKERTPP
jgi:hypothetical protein